MSNSYFRNILKIYEKFLSREKSTSHFLLYFSCTTKLNLQNNTQLGKLKTPKSTLNQHHFAKLSYATIALAKFQNIGIAQLHLHCIVFKVILIKIDWFTYFCPCTASCLINKMYQSMWIQQKISAYYYR